MLKKFLKRTMDFKKSMLVFKAAVLIVVFIFVGNLIAWQIGITDQLSKIFYWPDKGLVAGEYEVRAAQAANFYARDYGAKGDGRTNDRDAIQKAIDIASNAGGGEVIFDQSRTYLTGNFLIKSNVTLVIEQGARIKASTNFVDYDPSVRCMMGGFPDLIKGIGVNNIGIRGKGVIEGTSAISCEHEPTDCCPGCRVGPRTIGIYESSNVNIRDITIINSANPAIDLESSDHIVIDNITIDNITWDSLPSGVCNDGIDIVNSQYVTVKNSNIQTNDDNVALKGGWTDSTEPVHDIIIENNKFYTPEGGHAMEIGYEVNSEIYNVWWRNNTIKPPEGGPRYNDVDITLSKGTSSRYVEGQSKIHHIYYENTTYTDGKSVWGVHVGWHDKPCEIYDIYWNGNRISVSGQEDWDTAEECSQTSPPSCTCSSWQDQGCGQGGCNQNQQNQMSQTRTCTPSGCASASQCVTDASCDNSNNGGAVSSCWDPEKGHCYPRVGSLQWGGARPEWYAKFDLVVTWQNDQLARKVKELNPHTYILPTNDWNFGGDFRGSLPDEWVLHRSDGSLYGNTIGDLMADPTQYALNVNGKKYNQALPESLAKKDLSIYDGIATDGIWADLFGATDVDIDRNGINDITEHGTGWIGNQYRNGWKTLLANLRNLIGNDKLIFLNYGHGDMTIGTPNYNGRFFEYWTRSEAAWEAFRQGVEGINANTGPDISMIGVKIGERAIDLEKGGSSKDTPRYIDFVRYGLASAAVAGTYIMADDWPEHYWANWVDEMDLNLGYPTGPAQKIEKIGGNSVCYEMWEKNVCPWVRFFDYGAVIVNPTRNILTIKDSDLKQFQGYNGLYYRFKGGQDPEVNNGQMFNQVTLTPYQVYAHNSENVAGIMGDGVVLVKEPTTMVSEIIIDTAYGPTSVSQRQAQLNDNWQEAADYYHSGNPNPEIDNPYWTTGPRWAADNLAERYHYTNSNNASAIFAPQINIAGEYEVFEWHGWHGKDQDDYQEASNVRYTINYTGGTTTGTIDQTTNYGQWNSLGKYTFNKGTSNNVTISSQGANGLVIADAVKFVYQVNFGNIKGVREVRASRYLTADFNCDNQVNIQDFGILLSHWQKQGQDLMNYQHSNCKEKRPIEIAPMNNSCALTSVNPTIDAVDIGMLLSCWGTPKDDGGSCCWK